jgi:hypothetical protein
VDVHPSALKHGVAGEDAKRAATNYLIAYEIDDGEPGRELRLGFDTQARMLEIVVLRFDDGREMVIHAMKIRPGYLTLLDEGS